MSNTEKTKKLSPKEQLLLRIEKKGGIAANRKALKEMQEFISKEMPNLDMKKIRKSAWK